MPIPKSVELSRFPNSQQIKAAKELGLYQAISVFGEASPDGGVQDWYDQGMTVNPPPLFDTGRKKRWFLNLPAGSPGEWLVFLPPGDLADPIQPFVPGKPYNPVPGVGLTNKVTMSILSRSASDLLSQYASDLKVVPRLDIIWIGSELCKYINFKGDPKLPEVQVPLCQLIPDDGGPIDFLHDYVVNLDVAASKIKYRANLPGYICMSVVNGKLAAFDLRTYQPPAAGGAVEANYPARGMSADWICREVSKIFFATDVVFGNRPDADSKAAMLRELFGR